jgi:hypothetical protein
MELLVAASNAKREEDSIIKCALHFNARLKEESVSELNAHHLIEITN